MYRRGAVTHLVAGLLEVLHDRVVDADRVAAPAEHADLVGRRRRARLTVDADRRDVAVLRLVEGRAVVEPKLAVVVLEAVAAARLDVLQALRDDAELFVTEQKASGFVDTEISRDTTVDGDHGRIETRTTTVIHDVEWLQQRHSWPGLKGLVIVESCREISGKIERETRYYTPTHWEGEKLLPSGLSWIRLRG